MFAILLSSILVLMSILIAIRTFKDSDISFLGKLQSLPWIFVTIIMLLLTLKENLQLWP